MRLFRSPTLRRAVFAAALTGSIFPATGARASTATATFNVSATVLSLCVVTTTDLAFGSYSGTSSTPTDATSSVVVTCSNGTPYTVSAGAGAGVGATVAARTMTNAIDTLNYSLYSNSGRTTLWGDGTLSTSTLSGTAGLLPTTYSIYGRIPALQHVSSGIYSDLVTVTVNY